MNDALDARLPVAPGWVRLQLLNACNARGLLLAFRDGTTTVPFHLLGTDSGLLGAPVALGGLVLAILVLTPESIAAVKAAYANRLQRSINILLGSVLASIGLTIPLVIVISLATGRGLELGLDPAEIVMLVLTLATAGLTFALPLMNVLLGFVHLLLFAAYLMLMFD